MSITSAMFTGVSGLLSNAEGINVIGNNLSNVNTIGFKYGRMLFSDMLSSNIGNSSQIGRGTQIQKVDNVFGQGSFESTEVVTDLAIQGNSFFALKPPSMSSPLTSQTQAILTRAGAFRTDSSGYLVNPEGYQVLDTTGRPIMFSDNATAISAAIGSGYSAAITAAEASVATAAGQYQTPADDALTAATDALTAATAALTAANATADAAAIAAATTAVTTAQNAVMQARTAVNNAQALTTSSTALTAADAALTVTANASTAGAANDANTVAATALETAHSSLVDMTSVLNAVGAALTAAGAAITAAGDAAGGTAADTAGTAATTAATANNTTVTDAGFLAAYNTAISDGSTAETAYAMVEQESGKAFAKISRIDSDGLITYVDKVGNTYYYNASGEVGIPTATATASQAAAANRIAVISPANTGGLDKIGGTLFSITSTAGVSSEAFSITANKANGTTEKMFSNSLEQSNVDMAAQFVKMILTQRAYSANSKTITTADEMTQEVLNLKR